MKRLLFMMLIFSLVAVYRINAQDNGDENGYFYASLSPYGTWIELNNGETVWRPIHMRHGWAPYTYGHWVWTDDGWYWDSDEPFGSVVYHYGRWYDDDYYGWIWVPDHVWAPAWVEWRYNDDYIGWAPLAPYASFSVGIGISFTEGFVAPVSYWHFLGYRHMCDPYAYNYYVPEHNRYRIYSDSRYRTNYGYSNGRVINRGIDVDYIRQRGGGRIVENRIERVSDPRDAGRRGNNNVVRAFIPTREQLTRNEGRNNVEIKRGTRASSLDFSKVSIGTRNNNARNEGNASAQTRVQGDNRNERDVQRNNPGNIREDNHTPARVQQNPNINSDRNTQPERMIRPQVRNNDNRPQQRMQVPERQNAQPQVRTQRPPERPNVQAQPQQRVQRAPERQNVQPQQRAQRAPERQNVQPQQRVQSAPQRRENPAPVQRQNNNNNNRSKENDRRSR